MFSVFSLAANAQFEKFETECLGIEGDGSQTLRAWGTGRNRADAVEQAKKNAVTTQRNALPSEVATVFKSAVEKLFCEKSFIRSLAPVKTIAVSGSTKNSRIAPPITASPAISAAPCTRTGGSELTPAWVLRPFLPRST